MTGRLVSTRSRWAVLLVLVLPLACEDGDSTAKQESDCVAATCGELGAACGTLPDGCGGTLECGCPDGQTCGGGGVANVCGAPAGEPCVVATCAQLGAACGTLPDGCGGTLDCGGCPDGQTCGGGGVANACGAPGSEPCVPDTCAQLGAACGSVSDGCGGTLDCGGCPDGQTCGGGGVANACGAPADGATRWVLALGGRGDEYVAGLGVRDDGVIVALTLIGGTRSTSSTNLVYPEALGLVWISPDGQVLRDRTYPVGGTVQARAPYGFAVSPLGYVFLELAPACGPQGCPDLGAGPIESESLVKLSPDGDPVWSVPYPGYGALAADRSGGVAGATVPVPSRVVKFTPGGERAWSCCAVEAAGSSIAFDAEGDAIVGQALRVSKVDAGGERVWVGVLSAEAVANQTESGTGVYGVTDVGVTDAGTVVAAGVYSEAIDTGGQRLSLPAEGRQGVFLAAFDGADGGLLWARSAGSAGLLPPSSDRTAVDVAVAGDGSIALLVATGDCDARVERWTIAGARVWSRSVGAPCANGAALFPWGFEWAPGGDLIVGGELEGPLDFGTGPVEGGGGLDGFVLDLAP